MSTKILHIWCAKFCDGYTVLFSADILDNGRYKSCRCFRAKNGVNAEKVKLMRTDQKLRTIDVQTCKKKD